MKVGSISALAVAGLAVAACAHNVPDLPLKNAAEDSAGPTIKQIVDHIACELRDADGKNDGKLSSQNYQATVTLLLKVEDTLGAGPKVAYTEKFEDVPDTKLVTGVALELRGQRKRTFTTKYVVDLAGLKTSNALNCADPAKDRRRLDLRGDLGIREIVRDGLIASDAEGVLRKEEVLPTFGSEVEFIVTKALTGGGPVWTLRYWSLPSGDGGLLDAKKLNTNNIIIAFAPPPPPKSAGAPLANARVLEAAARKQRADALLGDVEARLNSIPKSLVPTPEAQQLEAAQKAAEAARIVAEAELAIARAELRAQERTRALEEQDAQRAAANASRDLLNTMLLQGLQGR